MAHTGPCTKENSLYPYPSKNPLHCARLLWCVMPSRCSLRKGLFPWGFTFLRWKLHRKGWTNCSMPLALPRIWKLSIAERPGAEGSPPSAAPGQVGRSTPKTLWGQLPAGGNIFSHWLSCHSGLEKFSSDLVSDLQVDLEWKLEHKDVLLTHCMKREADEVIYNSGSPTLTRAKREILFLTQGWTKATGWFVRRLFGEGLRNADSRIRKSGLRFQLFHFLTIVWP